MDNERETKYDCRSWSFEQLAGMIDNNPGNASLLKELKSRREALGSIQGLGDAVRSKIGELFGGERNFNNPSQFVEIENEIARQFPEIGKPEYKGMVAETIHAVCQEWEFRGQKNVYTKEDEEKLSPENKAKLESILARQYIETGITGQHLYTFYSIATARPEVGNLHLVREIASLERVVKPGGIEYVLPGSNRENKDYNEPKENTDDLPNDTLSLIEIINNRRGNWSSEGRLKARKKILNMFDNACGDSQLGQVWRNYFEASVEFEFTQATDWQDLSNRLSRLISQFESEDTVSNVVDFTLDLETTLYKLHVRKNPSFRGLITALLLGCQTYANYRYKMSTQTNERLKKYFENQIEDILEFRILLDEHKQLIKSFEQRLANAQREGVNKTSGAEKENERRPEPAEGAAKHEKGADKSVAATHRESLPEDIAEQRAFLQERLNKIKSWGRPLQSIPNFYELPPDLSTDLNSFINYLTDPRCDKELAREFFARLRLYNCARLMVSAQSASNLAEFLRLAISGDGIFLLDEYRETEGRGTDTEVIFRIRGVREAFLIIQEADVKGYNHQGKVITANAKDLTREERTIIRDKIFEDMIKRGFSEDVAKDALELAREYYEASGEGWVWDEKFVKYPKFSSLIYTSEWRNGKRPDIDRGLEYTVNNVESLGVTSYLRCCQVEEFWTDKNGKPIQSRDGKVIHNYLFLPEPEFNLQLIASKHGFGPFSSNQSFFEEGSYKLWDYKQNKEVVVISHKPCPDARRAFCARNWGVDIGNNNQLMYVDPVKIDFSTIKAGEYINFINRICNAYELLQWFQRSQFQPGDFSSDELQKLRQRSMAVDPTGFLNINFWIAYGIFCYYKSNSHQWPTESQSEELMKNLTNQSNGLVSEEQMRIIKNKVFRRGFLGSILGTDVMYVIHRVLNRIGIELSPERR